MPIVPPALLGTAPITLPTPPVLPYQVPAIPKIQDQTQANNQKLIQAFGNKPPSAPTTASSQSEYSVGDNSGPIADSPGTGLGAISAPMGSVPTDYSQNPDFTPPSQVQPLPTMEGSPLDMPDVG